jgi:hypothetical protein
MEMNTTRYATSYVATRRFITAFTRDNMTVWTYINVSFKSSGRSPPLFRYHRRQKELSICFARHSSSNRMHSPVSTEQISCSLASVQFTFSGRASCHGNLVIYRMYGTRTGSGRPQCRGQSVYQFQGSLNFWTGRVRSCQHLLASGAHIKWATGRSAHDGLVL